MALVMTGTVTAVTLTKNGKWQRVIVPASGRMNDLVMVPVSMPVAVGDDLEMPVRAAIETREDGTLMRQITFWWNDRSVA